MSARPTPTLFYGIDGAVVSVDVDTTGVFKADRPRQLFAVAMHYTCSREMALRCPSPPVTWEVLDGERFLINPGAGTLPQTPPMRVIEHWTSLFASSQSDA